MRKRSKTKTLDRKKAGREALLRSLAEGLILYEKIQTTDGRAKTVRSLVERLITYAKDPSLAHVRYIEKRLYTKNVIAKLIKKLGPRYKEVKGGYTRIIKLEARRGDAAHMVRLELV